MKAKIAFLFIVLFTIKVVSFAHEADCIILQDESSIVCKYTTPIYENERTVEVRWISPSKEIDRQRDITIPPNNVSIYDFRYLDGREAGLWEFVVLEKDKVITSTQFTIE